MPERFFIGGGWAAPSSTATLEVIDPSSEAIYLRVAEAQQPDMARAVGAAREAFDSGPWHVTHAERAAFLRARDCAQERSPDCRGTRWTSTRVSSRSAKPSSASLTAPMSLERSAFQLRVVPAHDSVRMHHDPDTLVHHPLNGGPHVDCVLGDISGQN